MVASANDTTRQQRRRNESWIREDQGPLQGHYHLNGVSGRKRKELGTCSFHPSDDDDDDDEDTIYYHERTIHFLSRRVNRQLPSSPSLLSLLCALPRIIFVFFQTDPITKAAVASTLPLSPSRTLDDHDGQHELFTSRHKA